MHFEQVRDEVAPVLGHDLQPAVDLGVEGEEGEGCGGQLKPAVWRPEWAI
jgi:hypothetical protein